jgi:hypothetical protein
MEFKLLTVVLSCKKHEHLWQKILQRNIPNLVILCGGFEETKLDRQILQLNCIDTYDGLPEKIMFAIDFLLNSEFNFTHILKADDHDTDFNSETIYNIQENFKDILKTNHYIGQRIISPSEMGRTHHFGKVPEGSVWYNKPYEGPAIEYCGGGETYILSKHAMNLIVSKKDIVVNHILEDEMIGSILLNYDIHPYKLEYGIKTWIG